MIFSSDSTVVQLDTSGEVVVVAHASEPGRCYLRGAVLSEVVIDGQAEDLPKPQLTADADEVELTYLVADRLQIVVRHTFAAGWGMRLAFSGVGDAPVTVDAVTLALRPAAGHLGWALAAGAEASYSVQPCGGAGLLLGGVLQVGAVDRVTSAGLHLGRMELARSARYVVQWHWDWYATPLEFGRSRHPTVPDALCATVGEVLEMGRDDDAALVVSDELEITETAEHVELTSVRAGSYLVEQRAARGTTRVQLRWVPPVEEIIRDRAEDALLQPRTSAGLIKLARLPDAMIVQHALVQALVTDVDDAADALDLYTARLTAGEPVVAALADSPPLAAAYLCGEYNRIGEEDLLDRAVAVVLAADSAAPGLGVAATQVCLALMVAGREVQPVLRHLNQLADQGLPAGISIQQQIAELELIAITWSGVTGPASAGRRHSATAHPQTADLTARVEALGRWFGAGLKGSVVNPLPLEQAAHLSTVLQLLPDGAAAALQSRWGCTPQALGGRVVPELVARLDPYVTDLAHVWLMLGQQPR